MPSMTWQSHPGPRHIGEDAERLFTLAKYRHKTAKAGEAGEEAGLVVTGDCVRERSTRARRQYQILTKTMLAGTVSERTLKTGMRCARRKNQFK